ncbi:MAG: flagellar hook-basal body complex protein FliE [Proteobacteria bacterium]|jgi:flagellar hook-basal body complex protein FliE|nr:flagellar hook-basal body complex protein FliE [Pseudomonadota bacterium]
MSPLNGAGKMSEQVLNTLRDIQREATNFAKDGGASKEPGMSFADHLKQGIKEVNSKSQVADKMAMELTTGKSGNIHETMLAATQAELSFNLMVQLRNKALEAYSEVMKMPV